MPIAFYPHEDDLGNSPIATRLEIFMEAAERYKAVVLETKNESTTAKKQTTPKDLTVAFNWGELAKLLREIRDLTEASKANKLTKADYLTKLAEIYEVLRAAKMAKLEAVRIALMNEATQLKASAAQVA